MKTCKIFISAYLMLLLTAFAVYAGESGTIRLIVQGDDMGSAHSANEAVTAEELIRAGEALAFMLLLYGREEG